MKRFNDPNLLNAVGGSRQPPEHSRQRRHHHRLRELRLLRDHLQRPRVERRGDAQSPVGRRLERFVVAGGVAGAAAEARHGRNRAEMLLHRRSGCYLAPSFSLNYDQRHLLSPEYKISR